MFDPDDDKTTDDQSLDDLLTELEDVTPRGSGAPVPEIVIKDAEPAKAEGGEGEPKEPKEPKEGEPKEGGEGEPAEPTEKEKAFAAWAKADPEAAEAYLEDLEAKAAKAAEEEAGKGVEATPEVDEAVQAANWRHMERYTELREQQIANEERQIESAIVADAKALDDLIVELEQMKAEGTDNTRAYQQGLRQARGLQTQIEARQREKGEKELLRGQTAQVRQVLKDVAQDCREVKELAPHQNTILNLINQGKLHPNASIQVKISAVNAYNAANGRPLVGQKPADKKAANAALLERYRKAGLDVGLRKGAGGGGVRGGKTKGADAGPRLSDAAERSLLKLAR
jgi:hypothetical protein